MQNISNQESAHADGRKFLTSHGSWAIRKMLQIRYFEEILPSLISEGLIYGSTHPSSGMEAIAVGVSANLKQEDAILSTHRGHGHCLAKGAEPEPMFAELFGRESGYCAGRGGSMHLAAAELGIMGTNGIVGAGVGIAVGAGLAADLKEDRSVVIAYFGDGAVNQGVVAESFNLASLWNLPIVFVCEDNGYAQSTASGIMSAGKDLSSRAEAFGVPAHEVDGMNVLSVFEQSEAAIDAARRGEGPTFLHMRSYRFDGHNGPKDSQRYRDSDEVMEWQQRDPIIFLENALKEQSIVDSGYMDKLKESVSKEIKEASDLASRAPVSDVGRAKASVYSEVSK